MNRRAAVFDVDRTLLDGMSGYLFSAYLIRRREMPWRRVLHSVRALAAYRFHLATQDAIVEAGATCLAGLNVATATRLADEAVAAVIAPRLFREALAAVERHRTAGDWVLLASGSNAILIAAIARYVGAHAAVGTDCRRDNGRLLPQMAQPPCVEEGKRTLVLARLAAEGITPENAICYTDNGIDIPLVREVGAAVAVNPDRHLAAYAREHGLPIEHWREPVDPRRTRSGTSWPLKV
ncbi:MAG: HAD-IB family hydrolase [Candidatus Lernaella stagnicola]|nr:HAD-IB family hydrolase [Candidatus Lernaella stagnicola]